MKQDEKRRDFLRKIPLALVSFSALSFLGFRKKDEQPAIKVASLSKREADELIRTVRTPAGKMKPAPPPLGKHEPAS